VPRRVTTPATHVSKTIEKIVREEHKDVKCRQHVVLALDVSGSMSGGKLDEAKRCIMELVKTCLLFGDTLELVTFASTVKTVMPQSKYVREVLPQPPATSATPHSSGRRAYFSQETLDDTLKALVADGRTALYDAVLLCMHRLEAAHSGRSDAHESGGFRQRFCQLIVVTDGEDAGSSTSLEEARALLQPSGVWASAARFHACIVGVGAASIAPVRSLGDGLKHVNVENTADGADGVRDAFRRITRTLTFRREEVVVTMRRSSAMSGVVRHGHYHHRGPSAGGAGAGDGAGAA
jgi:uncharacterized protein YegL